MIETIKNILYFPAASYFGFFARIKLKRWRPRIIVVTGSSGKTTLLHLIQAQLRDKAKYSHHANSALGIPFDILDLHRETFRIYEWVWLILKAPFNALKKTQQETIYIVEADADRPNEGKFLSTLLEPEVTIWLDVSRTHSMNYDHLVIEKKFETVDEAIAYEFGYFLEKTKKLVIINTDSALITDQSTRTNAQSNSITIKQLDNYSLDKETTFSIDNIQYTFPYLLPKEVFYSIAATISLCKYLGMPIDEGFKTFENPIGRSTVFKGIQDTTIIDSSYNANLGSMRAMLSLFELVKAKKKWIVLADLLEQGNEDKEEHEKLAEVLSSTKLDHIILKGSRNQKYTYPKLLSILSSSRIRGSHEGDSRLRGNDKPEVVCFLTLGEVLEYVKTHIQSDVAILFKGSQSMMLEGVIEHLLADKKDAVKLPRREQIWKERRSKQGV